jgi:hypothetical protein
MDSVIQAKPKLQASDGVGHVARAPARVAIFKGHKLRSEVVEDFKLLVAQ